MKGVFPSLAAIATCDSIIRSELNRAGIDVVRHEKPMANNRFAHLSGILRLKRKTAFTFVRTWWKYEVQGLVTTEVAKDLDRSLVGQQDIKRIGEIWVIDTEVGLHLFVQTLRKHGLVDPPTQTEGRS